MFVCLLFLFVFFPSPPVREPSGFAKVARYLTFEAFLP